MDLDPEMLIFDVFASDLMPNTHPFWKTVEKMTLFEEIAENHRK